MEAHAACRRADSPDLAGADVHQVRETRAFALAPPAYLCRPLAPQRLPFDIRPMALEDPIPRSLAIRVGHSLRSVVGISSQPDVLLGVYPSRVERKRSILEASRGPGFTRLSTAEISLSQVGVLHHRVIPRPLGIVRHSHRCHCPLDDGSYPERDNRRQDS